MIQTWKEIQASYPDEHVVVVNIVADPETPAVLEAGEVIAHDTDLDSLFKRCDLSQYDFCAIKYTGDIGKLIGECGMMHFVTENS